MLVILALTKKKQPSRKSCIKNYSILVILKQTHKYILVLYVVVENEHV